LKQVLFIFGAMLLGILFYQGYHLTFLVRYTVMLMLFLAFLNINFSWKILHRNHIWVCLVQLTVPVVIFYLLRPFNLDIALACFTIGIAPTAAGAPVMAAFLKTKIEFVTASVILTTPVVAVVLPFLLPYLVAVDQAINTLEVLGPTAVLVFLPLVLSQIIRRSFPSWLPTLYRFNNLPFYLFVFNIYIAAGKATHFIRFEAHVSTWILLLTALSVALVGFLLFKIGEIIIGQREYTIESGLALGRKNTMFALWIALTFINPMVALGPIFYILFQNSYNSWQLYNLNKIQKKIKQATL
jgi:BASS family bile acid:Na+ symporter